jgi:hypothetical protein
MSVPYPAGRGGGKRTLRRGETMLARRLLVLVAAFSAVLLVGGWGHDVRAQAAQDEVKGAGGEPGDVTLRIEGDRGARFSGVCSVGGERRDVAGEVPQSFEFAPGDRKLSCEIRKRDGQAGALEVVLSGEGIRSVQRIGGGDGTVRLTYDGGSVSSSSMSSFSSQTAESAGSSSFPAAEEEAGRRDRAESLADRIKQKVDEILERVQP